MDKLEENNSTSMTIGDIKYVTTGNIIFSDEKEYFQAESALLGRFDALIEKGILSNGMSWLMDKVK
ncbi:MAG: hypothetical protein WCV91_01145 [Candidatus Margulisiibacteriota bacterium]|jgi:hypothetical protein